ncbi:aspartic proteinase CDR1-like [Macadamia integrifolia]|uniref:aspartic proteinase CDR1-like n=1 Tax=Macadamia integrifolia TaxID=60698 RepID=UPI001C4F2D86|nr:aspartic proteinase CDR1-like [Macadamia integrifolia]
MASYISSCSPSPALVIVFFSIYLSTFSQAEAGHGNGGFSVDLIHWDSILSPSYDPSVTHFERLQNAFRRSVSRVNYFKQSLISPSQVSTTVSTVGGIYLMEISFGTPPVSNLAIADTGSDLIWIQCKPCVPCYKQNAPLFDPTKSSTYKNISCHTQECDLVGKKKCSSEGSCGYSYGYGDKSFTNGYLATETFTLGSTSSSSVSLPKKIFGCGNYNQGNYKNNGSGLVGLGGGPLSLISQMKLSIGGKFSYCLVPIGDTNARSKLNFGSDAVVSGDGVVSTPLVSKNLVTFYYVTLEGISVGNKRLAFKTKYSRKANAVEGNIILDSGTTLTYLPSDFYNNLVSELKKSINAATVADPIGELGLCYKVGTDINVPITAHFTGADVQLKTLNAFIQVSEDVVCITFEPVEDDIAIIGNIAQNDFLIGYDLEARKVYFKPTDCTRQ